MGLRTEQEIMLVDIRHHFAQQVYFRREAKGWTQEDVASRAGMPEKAISNYETGHRSPGFRTLVRFAYALDCQPHELLEPWSDDAR